MIFGEELSLSEWAGASPEVVAQRALETGIALWSQAATPPPHLTVSQWADEKRRLPQSSGANGGRWRTDVTPYLRGIMDSVHEPGVEKIALMKCAQSGGSEAINNILGYHIEHDPCPMLLVQPTDLVAVEWSKERLADMIRTTPALSAVISHTRAGKNTDEGESTLKLKLFAGGYLALGGANTPNTFARRAARLVFGDDVDRFPAVVGEDGDPAELLFKRTETFYNPLAIYVSTPTLKGGRIDTLYQRSDQRRYFVTCPFCGHEDWMTWSDRAHFRVVYDHDDAETARLECPACEAQIDEAMRREMVHSAAEGEGFGWRATAVSKDRGLIGFHLPNLITTLGSGSLTRWVSDWLSARQRGKESTRVFINTGLGEGWEDRGARMNPHVLTARKEDYGNGVEIPAAAVAVTAGVDVQENRFELLVTAWGMAGERWVVDWRSIPGDPKQAVTRDALRVALERKYAHATGHQLPIHAVCIDTGFATDEMYDFVLAYQARRYFATKGFAGRAGEPIVGKPSDKTYGRAGRPVRLWPINVDDAKGDVVGAFTVSIPGPGYMHFPMGLDSVDEEFFAQLCAEHRETRYNKAGVATHSVWVLDRDRNEALDCAVLCLAAFRLLNPNIRQMLEALRTVSLVPSDRAESGATPVPAPAPRAARPRQSARSGYLSR